MDFPLVSIALCTYNGGEFLIEQLETLVNQNYPNLELIIVDDCSSDQTIEILNMYASKYPFIQLYINQSNLGYIKNFEKAISLCKGDYIALSDQDDLWELHKITTLYNQINDHLLIYHDSKFINDQGQSLNKKMSDVINLYSGNDYRPFLLRNCVSGHAIFFKKELVNYILPFDSSYFHDWWIAYITTQHGTIGLQKECLVKYRQHESASTDILNKKTQKKGKELYTGDEKSINWIAHCKANSSPKAYTFINKLHELLLKKQKASKYSYMLSFFLIRNMKTLFYTYKKNFWSRLNLIRKISRIKQH